MNDIFKLENWGLVEENKLHGQVYNHPNFENGSWVTTSRIVGVKNKIVITYSGSHYDLGKVNDEYERLFPNAANRFFNRLTKTFG